VTPPLRPWGVARSVPLFASPEGLGVRFFNLEAKAKLPSKKPDEVQKARTHNPSCVLKRNQNSGKYPTSLLHKISAVRCEAKSNNSHKPSSSKISGEIRGKILSSIVPFC